MQFPVRIAFAMTINKSQGQTLKRVGLDLRNDVFAHGQLYVACSRVGRAADLTILAVNSSRANQPPVYKTNNIVYRQVLTDN